MIFIAAKCSVLVTMKALLDVFVEGLPKGQPRPRARRAGKHIVMYDPGTADDWTSAIRAAITDALDLEERWSVPMLLLKGAKPPLSVTMHFVFPRPKSHLGTGRNSGVVKASAPVIHTGKPAIDNAVKLVLDALGTPKKPLLYADDSCVVSIVASKRWAKQDEPSGLHLLITESGDQAVVETT